MFRSRRRAIVFPQPTDELVAVQARQARVAEDQVGCREFDLGERIGPVARRRDAVPRLLQAYFQHPDAARVGVDQKELFLCHYSTCPSSPVGRLGKR